MNTLFKRFGAFMAFVVTAMFGTLAFGSPSGAATLPGTEAVTTQIDNASETGVLFAQNYADLLIAVAVASLIGSVMWKVIKRLRGAI